MVDGAPIVIDNGSYFTRVGFGGSPQPYLFVPSITAHWKESPLANKTQTAGEELIFLGKNKYYYVGEEAQQVLSNPTSDQYDHVSAKYPLKDQTVDFDELEKLWKYILQDSLKLTLHDTTVLMNTPPYFSKSDRHRMLEMLKEQFDIPRVLLERDATLAAYGRGQTDATVISLGHSTATLSAISSGYNQDHLTVDLGETMTGEYATQRMRYLLTNSSCAYTKRVVQSVPTLDVTFMRRLKESYAYVATHYNQKLYDMEAPMAAAIRDRESWLRRRRDPRTYLLCERKPVDTKHVAIGIEVRSLPTDDSELMFAVERVGVPEVVFDPARRDAAQCFKAEEGRPSYMPGKKYGKVCPIPHDGLPGKLMSFFELMKKDSVAVPSIKTVVITGGNVSYPGFIERLSADLFAYSEENNKTDLWNHSCKLLASHRTCRTMDAWQGGSIVSTHPSVDWITNEVYQEYGTDVLERRY